MYKESKFYVWPEPQEIELRENKLSLSKGFFSVKILSHDQMIRKEAERIIDLESGQPISFTSDPGGIEFSLFDMNTYSENFPDMEKVSESEGYILDIRDNRILLSTSDAKGLFYGFQTLKQLLNQLEDYLPELTIRDWPAKSLRGAHLFLPSRKDLDFMLDFIDFLARYKYNTLFIEVGAVMEFDRHPEINRAWQKLAQEAMVYTSEMDPDPATCDPDRWEVEVMPKGPYAMMCSRKGFLKDSIHPDNGMGDVLTKKEVNLLLRACADKHIEVIPEVQSLSHTYYLCMAYPEIAERSEDPWPDTYCPSNPKSYELLFDIIDEILEVFNPKMVHIGHDEIYSIGLCPKCRDKPVGQLMADDINKIYNYLSARNIKVAMWGDRLIPADRLAGHGDRTDSIKDYTTPDVSKAIDLIAKDILIVDWYWGWAENTEEYFNEKGFQYIYGNFDATSKSMADKWRKRASGKNILGGETSTWCEVSFLAFAYNGYLTKFCRNINNFWHGKYKQLEEIRIKFTELMSREYQRLTHTEKICSASGNKIIPLNISEKTTAISSELKRKIKLDEQHGFEPQVDQNGFLSDVIHITSKKQEGERIEINRKLKGIKILHTSISNDIFFKPTSHSWHRGPAELMKYIINYADGSHEQFTAIYRQDIGVLFNKGPVDDCCFSTPVTAGDEYAFYIQTLKVSYENKIISDITILPGKDARELMIPAIGGFE